MFSPPYLVFLGDARDALAAKMGIACAQWAREKCVGQLRLPGCVADAALPDLTVNDAVARGAKTLVLGVVARGGKLEPAWSATIVDALARGMDVVSGMHQRLASFPEVADAANRHGRRLFDIRHTDRELPIANGKRRTGKRLLTVGTDCSCGKMFTTLAIAREMKTRGIPHTFRATGQTGILIAGDGIAVDAVVADFIAGAVELLAPDNAPDHWDLIEGQGSLFHPSFAGVSLGLLHGAQPDALVMCHEPTRRHMRGVPGHPIPDLVACIDLNLRLARLTAPEVRLIGVSVNTSALDPAASEQVCREIEARTGLPALDPAKHGCSRFVDVLTK
jgi:uncharacterized NAD-dependent epimerase/dehydratase family protein